MRTQRPMIHSFVINFAKILNIFVVFFVYLYFVLCILCVQQLSNYDRSIWMGSPKRVHLFKFTPKYYSIHVSAGASFVPAENIIFIVITLSHHQHQTQSNATPSSFGMSLHVHWTLVQIVVGLIKQFCHSMASVFIYFLCIRLAFASPKIKLQPERMLIVQVIFKLFFITLSACNCYQIK